MLTCILSSYSSTVKYLNLWYYKDKVAKLVSSSLYICVFYLPSSVHTFAYICTKNRESTQLLGTNIYTNGKDIYINTHSQLKMYF